MFLWCTLRFLGSDPAAQLSAAAASVCGRRAGPLRRDPPDLGSVRPPEVGLQLSRRRRDVSVDDHPVEQVPALVLHGFSQIDHVLEVFLLSGEHARRVKMPPPLSSPSSVSELTHLQHLLTKAQRQESEEPFSNNGGVRLNACPDWYADA